MARHRVLGRRAGNVEVLDHLHLVDGHLDDVHLRVVILLVHLELEDTHHERNLVVVGAVRVAVALEEPFARETLEHLGAFLEGAAALGVHVVGREGHAPRHLVHVGLGVVFAEDRHDVVKASVVLDIAEATEAVGLDKRVPLHERRGDDGAVGAGVRAVGVDVLAVPAVQLGQRHRRPAGGGNLVRGAGPTGQLRSLGGGGPGGAPVARGGLVGMGGTGAERDGTRHRDAHGTGGPHKPSPGQIFHP